jgi:hypothetical protein
MSFIADNQNFIKFKLGVELSGLSDTDKLNKYSVLRPEIIRRLKKSRESSNDLSRLYFEAFDIIGFYDADFLLLNVFFEDSCTEILDNLLKANVFSKEYNLSYDSIGYHLNSFLTNKLFFRDEDLDFFLQQVLITKIGVSENDWKNKNERSHPILSHFSDYIINSFKCTLIQEVQLVYLIFVKVWNTLPSFTKPYNLNIKAIILLNAFNKEFSGEGLISINCDTFIHFFESIKKCFDSLIFSYDSLFLPFLDSKSHPEYISGYLNQREKYHQIYKKIEELCNISIEDSYYDLIIKIIQTNEPEIIEKYNSVLNKKMEEYEYPSSEELEKIRKIELSNDYFDVQTDFFSKIYFY